MKLKNFDPSKIYNGSWTVILLAIDPKNNAKLHSTSLKQLVRFSLTKLLDLRLYLTEVHSIMKFAVQITVMHRDSKFNYQYNDHRSSRSQYNVWSPTELWQHCSVRLYTDHNNTISLSSIDLFIIWNFLLPSSLVVHSWISLSI